jgi:hypothetical protein
MKLSDALKFFVLSLLIYAMFLVITGFSYLDPGTGSLLVQVLIATFIAAAATIRRFWKNIKGFFNSKRRRK